MTNGRVVVVGGGFMGAGIAQVCAQSGYHVHLVDVKQSVLDRALEETRASLEKLSAKGNIADPPDIILDRITPALDVSCASQADWIIEAAPEIRKLKQDLFRELDRLAPEETPIATNTSSIPVSKLAEVTGKPEKVLGLHFFGPVPLMKLVEVVKGDKTAENVFEKGVEFIKTLGKTPVKIKSDIPGFVMNRIFLAAFREAVDLVADGVVSPEEVDVGMKLGYGWNAGPFEIADNAGLDTFSLIIQSFKSLSETGLCPRSKTVEQMVSDGRLGRKCRKGFYNYTTNGKRMEG